MTKSKRDERDFQIKVAALVGIHTTAAQALVSRSTEDVEALESLCDAYLRKFGGRTDPDPTALEVLMNSFKLTQEDVAKLVAEHIGK